MCTVTHREYKIDIFHQKEERHLRHRHLRHLLISNKLVRLLRRLLGMNPFQLLLLLLCIQAELLNKIVQALAYTFRYCRLRRNYSNLILYCSFLWQSLLLRKQNFDRLRYKIPLLYNYNYIWK